MKGRDLPAALHVDAAFARSLGGTLHGESRSVTGVAPLEAAGEWDLAYAEHKVPPGCRVGVLFTRSPVEGQTCVVAEDPKAAFITLLERVFPERQEPGVHPSATVHPTAVLGAGVVIHAGVQVGARCEVGEDTVLFANVVLYPDTIVGRRCRIHAGCVLGADGFSYHPGPTGVRKVPQVGKVVLGDEVELGANCTIDRAFLGETRLGAGCKLDDQVHIGHNVQLGRSVLIAAQTGLSGSVQVGDGAQIGGQVGVAPHVVIGAGAKVAAMSGVRKDVPAGTSVAGLPALPLPHGRRVLVAMARLPEILRRLRVLEDGKS